MTGVPPGVTHRPGVLGGVPCITGTRAPAADVARTVAGDGSVASALHCWPDLDRARVLVACWWAATHTTDRPEWSEWAELHAGTVAHRPDEAPDPFTRAETAEEPHRDRVNRVETALHHAWAAGREPVPAYRVRAFLDPEPAPQRLAADLRRLAANGRATRTWNRSTWLYAPNPLPPTGRPRATQETP